MAAANGHASTRRLRTATTIPAPPSSRIGPTLIAVTVQKCWIESWLSPNRTTDRFVLPGRSTYSSAVTTAAPMASGNAA